MLREGSQQERRFQRPSDAIQHKIDVYLRDSEKGPDRQLALSDYVDLTDANERRDEAVSQVEAAYAEPRTLNPILIRSLERTERRADIKVGNIEETMRKRGNRSQAYADARFDLGLYGDDLAKAYQSQSNRVALSVFEDHVKKEFAYLNSRLRSTKGKDTGITVG